MEKLAVNTNLGVTKIEEYGAAESRPNVCPKCGSCDSFEWGSREEIDEYLVYDFECKNCNAAGREYRKLTFDGYEVDVEN